MNILVVDDDESNLDFLEVLVLSEGYKPFKASDAKQALEILGHENIDLVVSDINMPGMSGMELAKKIKEEKKIPIILLTALTEKEDLIEGLKSGADEFVTKPFLKEELLLRIRNILKLKEYQNNLEQKVSERTKELNEALQKLLLLNKEMANRLLVAVEFRDTETGKHIIRVGKYCRIIAANMLFEEEYLDLIEQAAPMHDLGKIGISDKILLKPGRLTPEEFEIMKLHTVIGARILEGSNFELLKMAYEIALTHHEKWDGSGYPYKLKADNIPLVGRVTALADVFDTLTSRRSYKPPFEWEKSIEIIKQDRGKHFDPQVVDAFFRGIEDIRKVFEEDKDIENKNSKIELKDIEIKR